MNLATQGGNRAFSSFKNSKHYPGANNTAAIVTIAAVAGKRIVLNGLLWSYNKLTPAANGGITIEDGSGNIVKSFDIVQGGPGAMDVFVAGSVNTAMIITLIAISDATGKLNVDYTLE